MKSAMILATLGLVPGPLWAASATLPAGVADLSYYAPSAKLTVAGDLVLLRCDQQGILASTSLAAVNSAAVNAAGPFTVDGAYLASARQKRELSIELNDNRTIKSLNATTTDRTGAVVTNIIKTIATVAGIIFAAKVQGHGAAAPVANPGPCNEATRNALKVVQNLRDDIASQLDLLPGASAADAEKIGKKIDIMANQISVVIANQLTISVSAPIELTEATPGSGTAAGAVQWTLKDLAKWFGNSTLPGTCAYEEKTSAQEMTFGGARASCDAKSTYFGFSYVVTGQGVAPPAERVENSRCLPASLDEPGLDQKARTDRRSACARSVVLVQPADGRIVLTAGKGFIDYEPNAKLGSAPVVIPQWGRAVYLPLDVKLFQSRTIGFTFDQFGRRQTFKWNSEATAENATAAIEAAAEAGKGAYSALAGPSDTVRWTAEIDELETRMKRNKLRQCETAIANGAVECK